MLNMWANLVTESAQLGLRITRAWALGAIDRAIPKWKVISTPAKEDAPISAPKIKKILEAEKGTLMKVRRAAASHSKSKSVRRSGKSRKQHR
jgi:hypothetical protein